jgi:hypothetical protein
MQIIRKPHLQANAHAHRPVPAASLRPLCPPGLRTCRTGRRRVAAWLEIRRGRNERLTSVSAGQSLCGAPVWSPPPESNRRPHPYHGTTRNRCADRRCPRSRPTVRAEVIGSLPAKLCAHFQDMGRSSAGVVAAQVEAPVHHPLDAAAGSWNTAATARVAPATTRAPSGTSLLGEALQPAQRSTRDTRPPKGQAPVAGATSSVLQPVQDLPVDPSSRSDRC